MHGFLLLERHSLIFHTKLFKKSLQRIFWKTTIVCNQFHKQSVESGWKRINRTKTNETICVVSKKIFQIELTSRECFLSFSKTTNPPVYLCKWKNKQNVTIRVFQSEASIISCQSKFKVPHVHMASGRIYPKVKPLLQWAGSFPVNFSTTKLIRLPFLLLLQVLNYAFAF